MATVYDETQEEEYEYDEEADWTDWTGAVTYDDWTYGDYCDYYQDSYWTEDSDWWTDGCMTTGLGRRMLLPLCLQHHHHLSLDHRPALQ